MSSVSKNTAVDGYPCIRCQAITASVTTIISLCPRNLLNYPGGDVAGLVRRAPATADPDQRQRFVLEAQRIVLEQALWQPLLVRRITFNPSSPPLWA